MGEDFQHNTGVSANFGNRSREQTLLFNIAGSLIVILIIYAGVRFMISRGNPGEIQKARGILYWALVGFAVVAIGKGFIYLLEGVISGIF